MRDFCIDLPNTHQPLTPARPALRRCQALASSTIGLVHRRVHLMAGHRTGGDHRRKSLATWIDHDSHNFSALGRPDLVAAFGRSTGCVGNAFGLRVPSLSAYWPSEPRFGTNGNRDELFVVRVRPRQHLPVRPPYRDSTEPPRGACRQHKTDYAISPLSVSLETGCNHSFLVRPLQNP